MAPRARRARAGAEICRRKHKDNLTHIPGSRFLGKERLENAADGRTTRTPMCGQGRLTAGIRSSSGTETLPRRGCWPTFSTSLTTYKGDVKGWVSRWNRNLFKGRSASDVERCGLWMVALQGNAAKVWGLLEPLAETQKEPCVTDENQTEVCRRWKWLLEWDEILHSVGQRRQDIHLVWFMASGLIRNKQTPLRRHTHQPHF